MNIKVLKNFDMAFCAPVNKSMVMAVSEKAEEIIPGSTAQSLFIINPETSEKAEVAPEIPKFLIDRISYASNDRDYVVFPTAQPGADDVLNITLYYYGLSDGTLKQLHSFAVDLQDFNKSLFLKVFVLDEENLIIQSETFTEGLIRPAYRLKMFDARSGTVKDIRIKELIDNGISAMFPLADNKCVIKAGRAYFPDREYMLKPADLDREFIFIIPVNQFISELTIDIDNGFSEIVEESRDNTTLPYIKVSGTKLIYAVYYVAEGKEEIIIYDTETGKKTIRINSRLKNINDLWHTFVVDGSPYLVTGSGGAGARVTDLNTQKTFVRLENGDDIPFVYDDLVVMTGKKKKLFRDQDYVAVYKFPEIYNNQIAEIKGVYSGSLVNGDDLIIFIENERGEDNGFSKDQE